MNLKRKIFLVFTVLGLFLCSNWTQAQQNSIKMDALEIMFVTDYDFVYNDRGTGADANWSMWSPKLPPGFSALGHYAHASHAKPTTVMIAVRTSNDPTAIAYPKDYQRIYHDGGTGGDQDGSIWMPIAPQGYRALGMVGMNGHGKPPTNAVVCVRTDLTTYASVGKRLFTDSGSGGDLDLSVYAIQPPNVVQDSKESFVTSGSFAAHASYAALTNSEVCYALKVTLPFQNKQITNTEPKQTSLSRPDKRTDMKLSTIAYIPCISIVDPVFANNLEGQVRNTPVYTLERYDYYHLQDFNTNDSNDNGSMSFSQTTGMTQEHATSMSHTFGVSMTRGLEAGAGPVKATMSVTLSYALSQTSSYSTSMMNQQTLTKQFTVPAHGAGAYYTLSHTYKLKRANGDVVKTWDLNTTFGHFTAFAPQKQAPPVNNPPVNNPPIVQNPPTQNPGNTNSGNTGSQLQSAIAGTTWAYYYKGNPFDVRFGTSGAIELLPSWANVNWRVLNDNQVQLYMHGNTATMTLNFDYSKNNFTATDWDGSTSTGQRKVNGGSGTIGKTGGKVPVSAVLSLQSGIQAGANGRNRLPINRNDPAATVQGLLSNPAIYLEVTFSDGTTAGPHDYHTDFADNVIFDDTSADPNDLIEISWWDKDYDNPAKGKYAAQLATTGKGVGNAYLKVSFKNAPSVQASVLVEVVSGK
ncbi:MAG: Vps62-related protein [Chitinophagales bacterium]